MRGYQEEVSFNALIGKTLKEITGGAKGDGEIIFICDDGSQFLMYHSDDCCESVTVEDVAGDLNDLIGSPILDAREETSNTNPSGVEIEYQDSFTWTFYILSTNKGSVTIRWYGESNGYYSESVSFVKSK